MRRSLLVAAMAAGIVAPVPALAAFDLYLKIDTIAGEVTTPGFANTMQVVGYATGVKRSPAPTCETLALTKYVDKASPILFRAAFLGTHFTKVELTVVRNSLVFLKYELGNVTLGLAEDSGDAAAAATTSSPLEHIVVTYTTMKMTYTPTNAPAVTTSIDCAAVTAS